MIKFILDAMYYQIFIFNRDKFILENPHERTIQIICGILFLPVIVLTYLLIKENFNYKTPFVFFIIIYVLLYKTFCSYYIKRKKGMLQMHEPENKFAAPADTLTEFIGQYVAGVAASMKRIVELIGDNSSPHDCSPNFYYFHFLSQVRMYYPGIRQKIEKIYRQDYDLWEKVIQKAKESGEIRSNTDVKKTAILFRQMFLGLSYEQAFLNGLNVDELAENFRHIYSLLKA